MPKVDSYIPAHTDNYKKIYGPRDIDLIVFHDMEAPESGETAEAVARYFQRAGLYASAHYNVDNNSVVRSVLDQDVAYHAPGANHNGIGVEHAGYARQTKAEWLDPYGQAMLLRSAKLVDEICEEYKIPVRFVGVSQLQNGISGITTHAAVSAAFRKSTHTDPGFNFPMDYYIALIQKVRSERLKNSKAWPVPIPKWFWEWAGWKLAGSPKGKRPASAPTLIPLWAWRRLKALLDARKSV